MCFEFIFNYVNYIFRSKNCVFQFYVDDDLRLNIYEIVTVGNMEQKIINGKNEFSKNTFS